MNFQKFVVGVLTVSILLATPGLPCYQALAQIEPLGPSGTTDPVLFNAAPIAVDGKMAPAMPSIEFIPGSLSSVPTSMLHRDLPQPGLPKTPLFQSPQRHGTHLKPLSPLRPTPIPLKRLWKSTNGTEEKNFGISAPPPDLSRNIQRNAAREAGKLLNFTGKPASPSADESQVETERRHWENSLAVESGAPPTPTAGSNGAIKPPMALTPGNEEGSNDDGHNSGASVPPQSQAPPSLAKSRTIYWAFAIETVKIVLVLGPMVVGILSPHTLMTFPQLFKAYNGIRQMVALKYLLPPWPVFVGLLAGIVPAAATYGLRSIIGLWMTEDAGNGTEAKPWYKRLTLSEFQRRIMQDSPLETEFLAVPNAVTPAKKNSGFDPVDPQRNGLIAVRHKNLARLGSTIRLTLYYDWVGEVRLLNGLRIGFLKHFGERMRVGMFRPMRWLFFVFTAPFREYWNWSEMASLVWKRLTGREISLLYHIRSDEPRRQLDMPAELRKRFKEPQPVNIQSPREKSENTVLLEDGRFVRIINAGSHTKGALDLSDPEVSSHLNNREAWLIEPIHEDVVDVAGTATLAAHLFFADREYEDHPTNVLWAIAAQLKNTEANPFERKGVQKDDLPITLSAHVVDPKAEKKKISNPTWILAMTAALGFASAFAVLSLGFLGILHHASLSPLSHILGIGAAFGAGSFSWLLYRTAHRQAPGWLAHRTLMVLTLASFFLMSSLRLVFAGPDWAQGPRARSVAAAAAPVADFLRDPKLGVGSAAHAPLYGPIELKETDSFVQDVRAAATPATTQALDSLHRLSVSADTQKSYEQRVSGTRSSRGLRDMVSLMAYYAGQDLLPAGVHERLLQSLLAVDDGHYERWTKAELVPILRKALTDKGIPVPHSKNTWAHISDDDIVSLTISDNGAAPSGSDNSEKNPVLDVTSSRPTSIIDPATVAGEAAASPLRSLKISPALAREYEKRFSGTNPLSKSFEAAVALFAHDAGQGFVDPADQDVLMRSLLDVRDSSYAGWVRTGLVPALRKTLSAKEIPGPNGASWNDAKAVPDKNVLIWTAPDLSAYVNDSEVFPAAEQVREIRGLLQNQHVNEDDMDSLINGLAYARVLMRMPPHIRALLPDTFVRDGHGALLAPLEAAAYHDAFIPKENRFPLEALVIIYDYDARPELALGRVQEYIGLVYRLAYESVREPTLKDTVVAGLKEIVPETGGAQGADLTEKSRHQLLLDYIKDQNPIMAIKLLAPLEQYRLGLAIVDAPGADKLKSRAKIKDLIVDITNHGTSMERFQAEVDAYLQEGPTK